MIAIGEASAGVRFDPKFGHLVSLLALGSPYLARLLCHHAGIEALDQGRMTVDVGHLRSALDTVITEIEGRMSPRTVADMQRFRTGAYPQLFAAIGEASRSADGWFTLHEVVALLPENAGGAPYVQGELQALGSMLGLETEVEEGEQRFRFRDDSLPVYLWLMIARDRLNNGKLENAPAAPGLIEKAAARTASV
jgi:hypothetical protein